MDTSTGPGRGRMAGVPGAEWGDKGGVVVESEENERW